jgi:hypothetical protein
MIEIEDGATPLEYDEIKGLIPTHIATKGELDALELENIARASAWMQAVKADKILNTDFIWGGANLAKTKDVRAMYIEALKKADNYNYEALLKFVRS